MATWNEDELRRIAASDDLHIAPLREDGVTHGTLTWIWSVVVDGDLYVRAYNGRRSRWYEAAIRQHAGRITAAGLAKDVTFEPIEGPLNDRIDDAYRAKYTKSPYLAPMIGARARAATVPHHTEERVVTRQMPLVIVLVCASIVGVSAQQPATQEKPMSTSNAVRAVSPALERYATTTLNELWKRPALSPRDRSLVTVTALIARQQTAEMAVHMERALDNGVTPRELSETITHLAFYSGWGNAMAAVMIAKDVFAQRGVGGNQLPAAAPSLLPLDEAGEAARVAQVEQLIGSTSPGLAHYTTEALFRNLWLRPDLSPRDRSLVTVSALIATGQFAQLPAHLNRAMNNGLTEAQVGEVIAHLAFYAGWPNAFSAATTAKDVFAARRK